MKSFCVSLFSVALVALLTLSATAAEKPEKKGGKKQAGPLAAIEKQIAALELTAEQKEKVTAILAAQKQHFATVAEQAKGAELTKEQKKAQKEAAAKAKADGKKGKEAKAEIAAAVKLTDEQTKAQTAHAAALKEARTELKKALEGTLNAEQLQMLGLGEKKKKKNT